MEKIKESKMENKELDFMLQEGEGLRVEFKESFDKSLAKEIVAFANSNGGKILLGVGDDSKVKGIDINNKLKSQIQDLAIHCDPFVKINLEGQGNILVIDVKEGKDKPYSCSSGFYLRQGPNSQKMKRNEILDFFNIEGKILFDEQINHNFKYKKDFDDDKFDSFLEKSKISKVIPIKSILKNIGVLYDKEEFKNAGVLFFCDKIEEFIPQAIITCVLYKGKDKVFIIDKKDFVGDIVSNYQNSVDFLYRNLKLKYEIKGFGPRKDILEVPKEALKEALVNALVHRNYSEKGANILVEIYDDRVEITNPGGLVSGIKESEFGKKSLSRNPLLFSLFKRINLVEKVGSGVNRIKKALKEAGLKPPMFEFTNFFTITFYRPKENIEELGKGGLVERLVERLVESQKEILKLISSNPKISKKQLSKSIGISTTAIDKNITQLKKKDLLKRIGPAKGGYWKLK